LGGDGSAPRARSSACKRYRQRAGTAYQLEAHGVYPTEAVTGSGGVSTEARGSAEFSTSTSERLRDYAQIERGTLRDTSSFVVAVGVVPVSVRVKSIFCTHYPLAHRFVSRACSRCLGIAWHLEDGTRDPQTAIHEVAVLSPAWGCTKAGCTRLQAGSRSLPERRGWHELVANKTATCFAIASNLPTYCSGHGPCLLRGSLHVAHFGGPGSGSKSSRSVVRGLHQVVYSRSATERHQDVWLKRCFL
jgi:hypothetical protein